MLTIGLTGGIGSGKSAACKHFENLGVPIVDADVVARDVVQPNEPALQTIASHFGAHVLTNGELNRAWLRQRIFEQPSEKLWLEQLLHPIIRERIVQTLQQFAASSAPYAILASPLLIESQQTQLVDRVIVIDIPETLQLSRTTARDKAPVKQIQAIMAAQLNRSERLAYADEVIDNSGNDQHLQDQVNALHRHYAALEPT